MFSGIIENTTVVTAVRRSQSNMVFTFKRPEGWDLSIDQSIAHNGVCLTIDWLGETEYSITAMAETLRCTNLGRLKVGDKVNLERAMALGSRLDGHIVQGHVDRTATCTAVTDADGSTLLSFLYEALPDDLAKGFGIVEKGSVTVNGVSLTAFGISDTSFKVSIIPYTHDNTNLGCLREGDVVNLEFDIIGKYIARLFPGANRQ
jgi:riboflavin synthase